MKNKKITSVFIVSTFMTVVLCASEKNQGIDLALEKFNQICKNINRENFKDQKNIEMYVFGKYNEIINPILNKESKENTTLSQSGSLPHDDKK